MTAVLHDRVIFVTGSANGMGRTISLALARAGADLVLAARDTAAASQLAEHVNAVGRSASVQECDVTNEVSVKSAFDSGQDALGRFDGLVCAHGVAGAGQKRLWEQTVGDFRQIFDVNVLGVMLPMREALHRFVRQERGSIVSIGGTFGFRGAAGQSLYSATKWALRGMSKSAALEAGAFGVRVNTVCPGPVEGNRLDRQAAELAELQGTTLENMLESIRVQSSLRRISQPEDIANAVVFLLSDAAKSITGQDLVIDCGS